MKISPDDFRDYSIPILAVVKKAAKPIGIVNLYQQVNARDHSLNREMTVAVFWSLVNQGTLEFDSKRNVIKLVIPKPAGKIKIVNLKSPVKAERFHTVTAFTPSLNSNLTRKENTMSKSKLTPEEVVVDFFQNADLGKVETVNNIIKSIVKRRLTEKKPALVVERKPRAHKTAAEPEYNSTAA